MSFSSVRATGTPREERPMSTLHLLTLLLALSVALHIGCAAAFAAWRSGTHPSMALLIGASATGTACALYLTAVTAYG